MQSKRGGGTDGHMSFNYVVSPPSPNSLPELTFDFKEYQTSFKREQTGLEIKIYYQ